MREYFSLLGSRARKQYTHMPGDTHYKVTWFAEQEGYLLLGPGQEIVLSLAQETAEWVRWLDQQRSFAFYGRNGHLNLLKERRKRGGAGYWYAYQRDKKRVIKRYVGGNEQVTMQRLEEIAALPSLKDASVQATSDIVSSSNSVSSQRTLPISDSQQFEPLLMAKLQLPRLQKPLLPREHLLTLLDKGAERKLTLITGPAGYGKTTLVGQWIAERSTHREAPAFSCVTLDEGDNDPLRFWRYIIAACQKFRPGLGKEALELLQAYRLPALKPLEIMLTALLNELMQLEHPCALVLDDFHVIHSSQVATTLNFFLDHLPSSLHLVMLIRGDPPLSLTRLRASNELVDIYPPTLSFSLEETRAFFEQELSITPSPKLLQQIYKRLDGWPTGLRLLTRELHWFASTQEVEQVLSAFAGSNWSIQDYFLNEIFRSLPAEQQAFLLQTSILPRVTASLCDAITDRTNSEQLIWALRGGDLFLIPLDTMGEWTRYHYLFAEAMQQEARRRLGDKTLAQLALRASMWYEGHGLFIEAIETALNAAQYTRAAHLLKQFIEQKHQENIFTLPEVYSLKRWLELLPEEELVRHPELCLHYALTIVFMLLEDTRFRGRREQIDQLLQVAEQRWRDANKTTKLAEVFAFRALIARQEGNILQAVTWAKQSLAWLPTEERTWRNLALTVVAAGEVLEGNLTSARELLLEALRLCELQHNLVYARATRGMLAGVSVERGELRRAAEQFRQMQNEARAQEDRDDIARTQLGLASILYQWNSLEEAERAVQEGLTIGEQMNAEEPQAQATMYLALIEHARGLNTQAQQRIMAWLTREQVPRTPYNYQLLRQLQATQAMIHLASGNISEVRRWFADIASNDAILPLLQRQREQVLYARLLIVTKDTATAIEQLENLSAHALQTEHIHLYRESQALLALAYSQQGSHIKARTLLHELLKTAHSENYIRLFLGLGEAMANLLRGLLPQLNENAILTYAQRILHAFSDELATEVSQKVSPLIGLEPLSPQEQKVLRLLAARNSNAEIARQLVVSVNTVRTQVQSIYRKLNVNNRLEASAIAQQHKLL